MRRCERTDESFDDSLLAFFIKPRIQEIKNSLLVFCRVEATGTSTKLDVAAFRIALRCHGAVPDTSAAMHTFFFVELRDALVTWRYGLSGAHFDTELVLALVAERGVEEDDVVGVARRRLDFASNQKRILVRDEKLSVVRDLGPTGSFHESIVNRCSGSVALFPNILDLLRRDLLLVVVLQRRDPFQWALRLATQVEYSAGHSRDSHADETGKKAFLESVARFFGYTSFFFYPALPSAFDVGAFQLLLAEGLAIS
jgi:hypothetical protein